MPKRGDSKRIRTLIFKRDKGICSGCRLDTEKLVDIAVNSDHRPAFMPDSDDPRIIGARYWAEKFGFGARDTLWDADHIIAVEEWPEGKPGLNDLAQFQTLCCHCHPDKSADHAKRRAKRRKQRKKVGPKEMQMREGRGSE